MSDLCASVRGQLFAFARADLPLLEAARVEAHIRRCATCAAVVNNLASVLPHAQRDLQPSPAKLDELSRAILVTRPPSNSRPFLLAGMAAVAVGVAVVVVVVVVAVARPVPAPVPVPIATRVEPLPVERPIEVPLEMKRTTHSKNVEMLTSPGFVADVVIADARIGVTQSAGFAVFAFRGGEERLEIVTPAATVRAVGTLFYVDVSAAATLVGVGEGRVSVASRDGTDRMVAKGELLRIESSGRKMSSSSSSSPAEPWLQDPGLRAFHDRVSPPAVPRIEPSSARELAQRLAEAARLSGAGKARAAQAFLTSTSKDPHFASHADILGYEIARLDAFALDDQPAARAALTKLSSSPVESVRVQAVLTTCELDLSQHPCAARACLQSAEARGGSLAAEATRLTKRWRLQHLACP
ncbi:MAG: hypothetical protein Q8O67_08210 [Deltaproteobacteria bacterium]|nr:hypothetical protein [Deltaproteobacteria bacterium]